MEQERQEELFETVIGLEVHAELASKTKIFCSCTTEFGGEPNTHCCPVCTGLPGTLPVLNRRVVEFAVAAGLALHCNITRKGRFDRKNYFYPDLPKAYQISQLYFPVCRDGYTEIETEEGTKRIGIHEIHMEEDAGKLNHDEWEDATLVDYNRCGVPLIEIVSEPDMRTASEAAAYLDKLRVLLQYLGVSDCKMQEGSLRADINLSVRPAGRTELGTRTEMKNMNSFKAIIRAIEGERKRQIGILLDGGTVRQETRRWDDNKGTSFAMRSKEDAQDYRYFPEPDLVPVVISEEWISRIKAKQPELREQKLLRYRKEYGLPDYDASLLTSHKALAVLFEETVKICKRPKEVSNWLMVEAMRLMKEAELEPEELSFTPGYLAALIKMVEAGRISRTSAKEVFEHIFHENTEPEAYALEHNLLMEEDDSLLESALEKVFMQNRQSVEDYHAGKERAAGFLVGQMMKELKGRAEPGKVNKMVFEKLKKDSFSVSDD